jgi:hypothetical protein
MAVGWIFLNFFFCLAIIPTTSHIGSVYKLPISDKFTKSICFVLNSISSFWRNRHYFWYVICFTHENLTFFLFTWMILQHTIHFIIQLRFKISKQCDSTCKAILYFSDYTNNIPYRVSLQTTNQWQVYKINLFCIE